MESHNKPHSTLPNIKSLSELPADLAFILDMARYAPSADNLQPWKFLIVNGEEIDLRLNERYISNYCDAGMAAPCISAGAVIENIRVAAQTSGYELKISYLPDENDPLLAAKIHFVKTAPLTHPHMNAVRERHTNRKFYKPGQNISEELFSNLGKHIPSDSGFEIRWLHRKEDNYKKLAKIVGRADQLRFEIPRLHNEFMNILRFKEDGSDDGLSLKSLDAGPSAGVMFPLIRSWERLKTLNRFGMSYSFNVYAKMQMLSSSAAGVITSPGRTLKDYIQGGEYMQRLWHETSLAGLAMQPMEGLPIFLINKEATGGKDLTAAQKKTIEELGREFYTVFDLSPEKGLILFFRIGYADPAGGRSKRRPLESFLTL